MASTLRSVTGRLKSQIPRHVLPLRLACLLLALAMPAPAVALSIFDIIQLAKRGYNDQQIISLIEATDSVFELEAEDLPRLKQLGLSEEIIRVMLERVPANNRVEPPAGRHSPGERPAINHIQAETGPPSAPPETTSLASDDTNGIHFSAEVFHEERSGGHVHMVVLVEGVRLLVLRDEVEYASPEARAAALLRRLEAAGALGDGAFYSRPAGSVVFRPASGQRDIAVLAVSAADAHAYQLRSGRIVTREILAAYWSDLLSDFWALSFGRPPRRTMALHDGEALGVLFEALERSPGGSEGRLRAAAEWLPRSTRHHLERLAAAVPIDYDLRGAGQ